MDDIKLAGKTQNINPTWKVLMKDVDLGEPTSCLDPAYLGCTQRTCKTSKNVVDNYRVLFESKMSAGEVENCFIQKNLKHTFPLGPTIWKVIRRNAW